jgi:hypothetical protein
MLGILLILLCSCSKSPTDSDNNASQVDKNLFGTWETRKPSDPWDSGRTFEYIFEENDWTNYLAIVHVYDPHDSIWKIQDTLINWFSEKNSYSVDNGIISFHWDREQGSSKIIEEFSRSYRISGDTLFIINNGAEIFTGSAGSLTGSRWENHYSIVGQENQEVICVHSLEFINDTTLIDTDTKPDSVSIETLAVAINSSEYGEVFGNDTTWYSYQIANGKLYKRTVLAETQEQFLTMTFFKRP